MKSRLVLTAAILGVASFAAPRAHAQAEASADALFKRGLADMEAGKFATGCPALAESLRLDRQPGTLFTLAECEAKGGKYASAFTHYDDYLNLYAKMSADERRRQRGRDKVAEKTKADIAPKVPKLTLRLPKDAPPDAAVSRDGVALGGAALGLPLPVDPGEHVIRVAVGDRNKEQRVTLAAGETRELLLELPAPAETAPAPEAPSPEPSAPPVADRGTSAGKHSNTLAWVAGGIGIAGLAVGSVTGAMVFGKKSSVNDHCAGTVCDQTGKDAADSAKSLGLVSTIGFGVGIAGIATSAVLFLTGGSTSQEKSAKGAPLLKGDTRGAFVGWQGAF